MANHDDSTSETTNKYDVFLSFHGEDTRYAFTGHLYDALCRNGVNTFMDDDELRVGQTIRSQLLRAIEQSRISIIVFSENYAASSWCLDELVKIVECLERRDQFVIPIFYRIEPSDVRYQKNSYARAMAAHEKRYGCDSQRVKQWRSALSTIPSISGFHLKEGYEFKFIQDVVSKATTKVPPKQLPIEEHIVGHQFRVAEVKPLVDIGSTNSTFMLGIIGPGGIGKTTLAKALYNSICYQFEGACFLFNVKKTSQDKGQVQLQQMLLSDLHEGKVELGNVEKGISTIKDRLSTKKVLIVLDDVDKIEQLKELAGGCDWFGPGSRIIITTRNKHLLVSHRIKKFYEMEVLNPRESLELFCQHAFNTSSPNTDYEDLSDQAIQYAQGLPLALKVIGSNLIGKDMKEWKSTLDKYEKNPPRDIHDILRTSYDSLECNEKNIFLDIACFFVGLTLEFVKDILNGCGFYAEAGIRILVDKSLITIEDGYLWMHDLILDMGIEIVYQEAPREVGQRSRLCFNEDALEVLAENTGSIKNEGIMLNCCNNEVNCINTAFEKMKKLRILIVQNTYFSSAPSYLPNELRLLDWNGYPSKSFPTGFYPKKIAALIISHSPIVLEKPFQKFDHLTYMNFSYCQSITHFPDVSGVQTLRRLTLYNCNKLVKVDGSIGLLPNLTHLRVLECNQLKSFVPKINLPSLEDLSFRCCTNLASFPEVMEKMDKPLSICMRYTAIRDLPHSIANLIGLEYLDMTGCKELQNLPRSLFVLTEVVTLKIGGCSQLRDSLTRFKESLSIAECWPNLETLDFGNACLSDKDVHVIMQSFPNLKHLNVASNYVVSFPRCIEEFNCLTKLNVSYCLNLQEIPELPSSVQKVYARHCYSLTANTTGMLWSQVLKNKTRLEVVMPNTEIPEWWDYQEQGGIPIFWARRKFPVVALVFVFGKMNYEAVCLHLYIEGEHVMFQRRQLRRFIVAEHHVLLCDLRVLFSKKDCKRLDARVGDGNSWKRVQVLCEPDMNMRHWGVHVVKQKTSMDDIQFKCPCPDSSGTQMLLMATNAMTGPRDRDEEEEIETTSSHEEDYSLLMRRVRMVLSPRNNDGLTAGAFSGMVYLDNCEKPDFWIKETALSCGLVAFIVFTVATDVSVLRFCSKKWTLDLYSYSELPEILLKLVNFMALAAMAGSLYSMLLFSSAIAYPLEVPDSHGVLPRILNVGCVILFFSSVCEMLALVLVPISGLEHHKCSDFLVYGTGFFPVIIFAFMQFQFYREVRRLVKRQILTLKLLAPTTLINDFFYLWKRGFPRDKSFTTVEQNIESSLTLLVWLSFFAWRMSFICHDCFG